MKTLRILGIALFALMIVIPVSAQQTGDPKSYMTPEQLLQFEKDLKIAELEKKAEQYGSWVGVGGEVGDAVKEGLLAVVDVADEFTGTDVGKFTMILVAWKVIGKDVVRIILGVLFALVFTLFMLRAYKNAFKIRRVLIKNPGIFKYPKEYELVKPLGTQNYESWEGAVWYKLLYAVVLVGGWGITYAIMFGGA